MKMARRQPITRKDHLKNRGKKPERMYEKPKSTETSMTSEDDNEKERKVGCEKGILG
jgi:hypothetical protein